MKKEKKKTNRSFIYPSLAALLIAGGFLHFLVGYRGAVSSIYEEHVLHLGDIVSMTDRNLAVFMERSRSELEFSAEKMGGGLRVYLEEGNKDRMLETMGNAVSLQNEVTDAILLLDETETLLSTKREDPCIYTFPYGRTAEEPCICLSDRGQTYIAMIVEADVEGMYYAALLIPEMLYQKVIGTDTDEYYWLAFYNSEDSVFLQSDKNQPEQLSVRKEDALMRNDGLSVMALSEEDGKTRTGTYYYNDPFYGQKTEYLISALPRQCTENGYFTIGVAVESRHYTGQVDDVFKMVGIASVLILGGILIFAVIIGRKTTESRRNEERLQQMEAELSTLEELSHHQRLEMMGMMTGSMAHELRNILTPIMGYSMMAMNKVPEENEELMNDLVEIYDSSLKAKNLVSRLLALSYKNNERKLTVFPADEIVNDVVELAKPLIPENVELETRRNCRDITLHADRSQIGQVFMNIVINALQAMEQGGRLTITTYAVDGMATFRFTDTGKGIPAEVLPKIFDPFFSTKGVEKGTGLGLAIVKHIITEHGGTVEAESEAGKGTTITVRLPVEK